MVFKAMRLAKIPQRNNCSQRLTEAKEKDRFNDKSLGKGVVSGLKREQEGVCGVLEAW